VGNVNFAAQVLMQTHRSKAANWTEKLRRDAADGDRVYFPATAGELYSGVGTIAGDAIVIADCGAGVGLYGPYIDLPQGRYRASVEMDPDCETHGTVLVEVCTNFARHRIWSATFDLAALPKRRRQIRFTFSVDAAAVQCEVRLHCPAGTSAVITGLEIVAPRGTRLTHASASSGAPERVNDFDTAGVGI